eukprot:Protomagalhaensia_sp_Gyna_25__4470@NODE_40_length_6583_cov_138_691015_g29_i0_p1_GENE_NODE_40_length_6583_cov_138_691015_g29_i0NODE_40_length_6583_cov_138_691015_g29_i0_p1_ORF_typecomplete_len710_score165_62Methyltransf_15/PF09445_10/9_9e33Methyltransf_31/PF13847_6/2_7e11Methyltransf_31/PF13847_6/7_7e02MTS/PF05175_14/9_7e10RNA_GG_bind/PF10258_9/8e09Methyltransf_25/PF13649_6/3_2e07Methyltransf_25/PF13649_6/1_8e03UPF0020/PF01170_18/5_4e06Met_10/PF02475_16/5_7e06PrmA/PF06325_13/1_9e05tRNA_U5meth_tr/
MTASGWLPTRAFADPAGPLQLALAGAFPAAIETLSNKEWTKPTSLNQYEGEPKTKQTEEAKEDEVISAVIKLTRITVLSSPLKPSNKRQRDKEPNKKKRKLPTNDSQAEPLKKREKNENQKEPPTQPSPPLQDPSSPPSPIQNQAPQNASRTVPSLFDTLDPLPITVSRQQEEEGEEGEEGALESHHRAGQDEPPSPLASAPPVISIETDPESEMLESEGSEVESDEEGSDDEDQYVLGSSSLSMGCPSLRAWNRRHRLWSRFDQGIQMDETAWYELTPELFAKRIATRLRRAIELNSKSPAAVNKDGADGPSRKKPNRPILMACCGVGGDAVALARFTPAKIICVDNQAEKVQMARHNAALYGVEANMEFICQDINEYAKVQTVTTSTSTREINLPVKLKGQVHLTQTKIVQDELIHRPHEWAVVSPPWGGPAYRAQYVYTLAKQGFADLIGMIRSVMTVADNVCLILPRNQDVDELIHLASKGFPTQRFPYLEIEKLTEKKNGYPLLVAAYFCRDPSLFLADHDPQRNVAAMRSREELEKLDKKKAPQLVDPRPALVPWDIADYVIAQKKAQLGKGLHLSVSDLHNLIYSRFILVYLEEPAHQLATTEHALQFLGIANFLWLVEETVRVVRKGGIMKKDGTPRSRGGVFFDLLRQCFPDVNAALRTWRRAGIRCWKENKKRIDSSLPSSS